MRCHQSCTGGSWARSSSRASARCLLGTAVWPKADAQLAGADRPALRDDDDGRPLFRIQALAPGERVQRCIRVRHDGSGPADVEVTARVAGDLARRVG